MKKRLIAAAAVCCLLLSSCTGETEPVMADTEETTTSLTTTTTTAATTTTEATTTLPPEPVYSDDCVADIEYFAISEENRFMTSSMEYAIDAENGVLSVNIDYDSYVDIYTLQNCIIEISVTDGEYEVEEAALNEDGTVDLTKLTRIILTDSEGLHRKYEVVTDRTVYDIPIVNIYLEDMAGIYSIDRFQYSRMTFFVDAEAVDGFSSTEVISGKIRGRGHSTWEWEKKPYRIKLDKGTSVLGLDKNKDWILLANYADKSLLRNIVAYRMGRTLDGLDWTPTQYPVDLFVNGKYRGVYAIGESMELGKDRVNIEENSTDADTGYLLEVGGVWFGYYEEYYFHTAYGMANYIVIQSPDEDVITNEQRAYIEDYLNAAERAIISGEGYEEYIDVDSFCDWMLIHEISYNLDCCFRRSCYLNKDKGGKLKMGPIWDFDLAFGNYDIDNQNYNDWVTVGYGSTFYDAYVITTWYNYLMENESFRTRLRERWAEVRDGLLETAMSCIDYYSEKMYQSQEENFRVWPIWGLKAGLQSDRNLQYESYDLQIQYLKDFIQMRVEWIDENI